MSSCNAEIMSGTKNSTKKIELGDNGGAKKQACTTGATTEEKKGLQDRINFFSNSKPSVSPPSNKDMEAHGKFTEDEINHADYVARVLQTCAPATLNLEGKSDKFGKKGFFSGRTTMNWEKQTEGLKSMLGNIKATDPDEIAKECRNYFQIAFPYLSEKLNAQMDACLAEAQRKGSDYCKSQGIPQLTCHMPYSQSFL